MCVCVCVCICKRFNTIHLYIYKLMSVSVCVCVWVGGCDCVYVCVCVCVSNVYTKGLGLMLTGSCLIKICGQFHEHFTSVTYSSSKISCAVHCMQRFQNALAYLLQLYVTYIDVNEIDTWGLIHIFFLAY
jgi:hypothetical protein